MELKEFIKTALTEIAEGVQMAIESSNGKGYLVNPSATKISSTYQIHFDLCVESKSEGNAGVKWLGIGIAEHSSNRITFDVAMTMPASGEIKTLKKPHYD